MRNYDYIIVGAGLTGCVIAERIASQLGQSVLLLEKRSHIGGNCFDSVNSDGIRIHNYGPHWFHTNDAKVVNYLSMFTKWRIHHHKVKSFVDGRLFPFPINMNTVNQLYDLDLKTESEVQTYFDSVREKNISICTNAEEMILSQVGQEIYEKFFKNYTIKQWGELPINLRASVTGRIPIRTNQDDRYFSDNFQGIPADGYEALFNKLIDHPNISVMLSTDYKEVISTLRYRKMVYTGPIDYFFGNVYGKLGYRSLKFRHETFDLEYYQECQQVNFPNDFDFTRILEWKHATGQRHNKTTITKEYPCSLEETGEPLYPIHTHKNEAIFMKYKLECDKQDNVIFCGRLAEYKYYNMDQVVARALKIFKEQVV